MATAAISHVDARGGTTFLSPSGARPSTSSCVPTQPSALLRTLLGASACVRRRRFQPLPHDGRQTAPGTPRGSPLLPPVAAVSGPSHPAAPNDAAALHSDLPHLLPSNSPCLRRRSAARETPARCAHPHSRPRASRRPPPSPSIPRDRARRRPP